MAKRKNLHTKDELSYRQALPLSMKVAFTKTRIREWINRFGLDGVYISFSGGKDSTVLSHIIDEMYPNNDIPRLFVDTGLEYPEIRTFAMKEPRCVVVKPDLTFKQVIEKYGYPFISKEVSECVYGAKQYLTKLLAENPQFDRQTDRQTDRQLPYAYYYDKLCGQGKYAKSEWGGYDSKYRKLRGICEYAKRPNEKPQGRAKSAVGSNVRNVDKRTDDKGEYP